MKQIGLMLIIFAQAKFFLSQTIYVKSAQEKTQIKRFLANQISCNSKGNCVRADEIPLIIGYAPRVPLNFSPKALNEINKEIVSVDPIGGSINPTFLKGSTKYVCGDGVNECFNSCCRDGFCSDPSNYCTIALKGSSAIIYSTCIVFFIITCFYWIVFGCIGVRYSKRRSRILKDDPAHSANLPNRLISPLEDFNDAFNTRPASGVISASIKKEIRLKHSESKISGKEVDDPSSEGFEIQELQVFQSVNDI